MADAHDNAPQTHPGGGETKPGRPGRDTMWTTAELLAWTQQRFDEVGIEGARTDAEHLLADSLGCTRVELYVRHHEVVNAAAKAAFRELVKRRLRREPVAYLLGRRGFHALDLELAVDATVLIPRPETEHLVDWVLEELRPAPAPIASVLDVGTGSGAIALALKKAREDLDVAAVDVSEDALGVARRNAKAVELEVRFHRSDLFAGIARPDGGWKVVVSNPPYIPSADIAGLQAEVRDHEPRLALDGGADGLDVIRRLVPDARAQLAPAAPLYVEIGKGQRDAVVAVFEAAGFERVAARSDYDGIDRVIRGFAPIH